MLSILALLGTFLLMPLVAQAQKYTITINPVEHATIKVTSGSIYSPTVVNSGDQVSKYTYITIQATPEEGYMVTHYIINGEERESNGGAIRQSVMENLTISARVAPATLHTVTITQPEHGTLKVKDGATEINSGDQKYFGTRLSVELTPETGYENEYWILNGKKTLPSTKASAKNKASLTVREDVTVTAQLKVAGTKTMVPVTVVKPEYATVKAYKGRSTSSPELAAGEQVEAGDYVTVVVTPDADHSVDYWLFNDQRVESFSTTPNEYTFRIIEASTITPVLKLAGYKITYEQPTGGTLTVKTTYPSTDVPSGSRVKERERLRIEATVEAGYQFKHFLINGKEKKSDNSMLYYTYETANSDMTIAAVIEKVKPCIVTITQPEHGTLTVKNSSSSAVIKDGEEVPMNSRLLIEAKVDPAYEFKHFLINGVETPHTYYSDYFKTYSCNYTATGPVTIAVVAVEKPSTVITVEPFEHGELVVKYGMYPNSVEVKSGDAVPQGAKLSVDAFFDDGYGLDHFLVNGKSKPSDDAESDYILLTVGDTPLKLSAVAKKTHGLIVLVQPDAAQGAMTAHYTDNGQQKDLQDSTWVALETPVTFVVTPKEGYEMDSWKVDDQSKAIDEAKPNELTLTVTADLKVEPVLKESELTEGKITMIQPKDDQGKETGVLRASYTDSDYGMTVIVNDGDMVDFDTKVTFEVEPAEGYEMDHWMIDDQRKEPNPNNANITEIVIKGNLKVEPILKKKTSVTPKKGTITFRVKGTEGEIQATYEDPVSGKPSKIIEQNPTPLPIGTKVTLKATLNDGYEVTYTNNNKPVSKEMLSADGSVYTFTVEGDASVVATIAQKPVVEKFIVTYTSNPAEGGTVKLFNNDGSEVASGTSIVSGTKMYDVDFDHQFIETEKYDAKPTYKKFPGYRPGVAVIGDLIVGIENSDGNTNVRFHQKDTLKRFFERFEQNGLTINRFRADCGSCSEEIVEEVEEHCKSFYIRANRCSSLYNEIFALRGWKTEEINGIEFELNSILIEKWKGKAYRLVIQRQKRLDGVLDLWEGEYTYRCILTNDYVSSVREIVEFYNLRGGKERIFDDMNNGFGWDRLPKSFMAENTVFLLLTALIRNFYKAIIQRLDVKRFGLNTTSRIKALVFRFVSVPAKWIRTSRQYVLNIYTCNNAYADVFQTDFG